MKAIYRLNPVNPFMPNRTGNQVLPVWFRDEWLGKRKVTLPTMFGYSTDCIEAAKIVIEAVEADAYKPFGDPTDLLKKDLGK